MKRIIFPFTAILLLLACQSKTEKKEADSPSGEVTQDSIRKIDVHAHFQYSRSYMPELFKKWNMEVGLVDVSKADSTGIDRSWDQYKAHGGSSSYIAFLCSSLIGVGIDEPDYAERQIARLQGEIDSGAIMVKVWKNFGMVTKDNSGKFIQIDDPRLQPIWDFLKEKGIPVMAHIAEPIQAWRPLDPGNPHAGYYERNPQYHAYNFPEIPTYETIIAARDNWIANNPDLEILGAHNGSMSHDVEMIAEHLDSYPNFYVEMAARYGDLARQDREQVRAYFEKYQDRILFGSDYGNSRPESELTASELEEEKEDLDASYQNLWEFLSGSDSMVVRGQKTRGLGLSPQILRKIYYDNAAAFLDLKE